MRVGDYFLGLLIIIGVGFAFFSTHYRGVLESMSNLLMILLIPIFFIILALMFFGGAKTLLMPGLKTPIITLIVLSLIVGVSSTLGVDVANQLTGNTVMPSKVIFNQDFLSAAFIIIIGVFLFFMVLVKK